MDNDQNTAKKPRRGIYLLPNLFTTAALFAGFYVILAAAIVAGSVWIGVDYGLDSETVVSEANSSTQN